MNTEELKILLEKVGDKKISIEEAYQKLKILPFEKTKTAHIDHHRSLRTGFPEVIFGQRKDAQQIIEICEKIIEKKQNALITRIGKSKAEKIRKQLNLSEKEKFIYQEEARSVLVKIKKAENLPGRITVITAGTADIPVAQEAVFAAEAFGATVNSIFDVGVAGIHRLIHYAEDIANSTVIIVVAGMEGALPSVAAGISDTPVIAVPTSVGYGSNFKGFSALLTMLNSCASVAVMNIDNGFGAARFACGMLYKMKSLK
ncbi:MAG: nickel pincer cofactor biosynthesis protein LarB [Spirochaetia bacterium]|nr:nickel pincer cofactor biosynthesis protein LarB [Spirochaetia bacterium]